MNLDSVKLHDLAFLRMCLSLISLKLLMVIGLRFPYSHRLDYGRGQQEIRG